MIAIAIGLLAAFSIGFFLGCKMAGQWMIQQAKTLEFIHSPAKKPE